MLIRRKVHSVQHRELLSHSYPFGLINRWLVLNFRLTHVLDEQDEDYNIDMRDQSVRVNRVKLWYDRTKWIWVLFALASVVLQATRSSDSSKEHTRIIDNSELALTLLFDIDIIWRFCAYLPDWRMFFQHGNNWLDLILAIGSSIIQIPVVHNSDVYPWLTIFPLARFYRVILEVPRMRPLLVRFSFLLNIESRLTTIYSARSVRQPLWSCKYVVVPYHCELSGGTSSHTTSPWRSEHG